MHIWYLVFKQRSKRIFYFTSHFQNQTQKITKRDFSTFSIFVLSLFAYIINQRKIIQKITQPVKPYKVYKSTLSSAIYSQCQIQDLLPWCPSNSGVNKSLTMQQYFVSVCLETCVWMAKDNLDCHPQAPSRFHLRQDVLFAQKSAHMPGQLAQDFPGGSVCLCLPNGNAWYYKPTYPVSFYVNSGN